MSAPLQDALPSSACKQISTVTYPPTNPETSAAFTTAPQLDASNPISGKIFSFVVSRESTMFQNHVARPLQPESTMCFAQKCFSPASDHQRALRYAQELRALSQASLLSHRHIFHHIQPTDALAPLQSTCTNKSRDISVAMTRGSQTQHRFIELKRSIWRVAAASAALDVGTCGDLISSRYIATQFPSWSHQSLYQQSLTTLKWDESQTYEATVVVWSFAFLLPFIFLSFSLSARRANVNSRISTDG